VTKNIVCGEGGAFLTRVPKIAERAEIIREKGTDRSKFLRGEVEKYTWIDNGSSYVISDLLAALIQVQFAKLDKIQDLREQVWWRYQRELAELEARGHIILPHIDARAEPNWHIYAFRVVDVSRRNQVLAALEQFGIQATFHYVPLHSSPYARARWGYRPEDLPVTELVSASLIRLPIYPELREEEQALIVDTLYYIFRH
jgi:dTDP-4-amino-4,6-dideoxygalactose transaminase